jgi:hypothetical protein
LSDTSAEPSGSVQEPEPAAVAKVRTGQKLMICAVLAGLLMSGLQLALIRAFAGPEGSAQETSSLLGEIWRYSLVVVLVGFQLFGLLRLTSGLGYSAGDKLFFAVLLVVPGAGVLTLLYLNAKATAFLRRAGYKVGLLGARR